MHLFGCIFYHYYLNVINLHKDTGKVSHIFNVAYNKHNIFLYDYSLDIAQ